MIYRLMFICVAFTTCCASAQIDAGISVTGVGSVTAKPSIAKLTFGVSANAEIAGDAITRFEQTRERVMEAIKKLAIPDAELEQEAFTIGLGSGSSSRTAMQMRMMHGNTQKTPSQVVLSQPVTVRLSNIDKLKREVVIERLSRIIDTARDLGLSLTSTGGNGSVQFLIADPETAKANALEAALDDARKRAEKIAARANVKLGPVVAIDTQNVKSSAKAATRVQYDAWGRPHTVPAGKGNDAFTELNVTAAVSVRYKILAP